MEWLIDAVLFSIAASLLMRLVGSITGAPWPARDHCDCAVPTPAADGPRCSTCGRSFDVTTGDRPSD